MPLTSKNIRAGGFACAGFSLFSVGDLFIKTATSYYTPEQCVFYSSLFTLPLLFILSPWLGGLKRSLKSRFIHLHILRALCSLTTFFMVVNGFKALGMATSYTLIFMAPFFATLISVLFMRETIHRHRWIAITFGFIGVLVVLRPGMVPLEWQSLGLIIGAITSASSSTLIRKIGEKEPLLAFSIYMSILTPLISGTFLFFNGELVIPLEDHIPLFAATAFFHVFAALLVSKGFSSGETSVVAPFLYVQLLWAILFGYFIFGKFIDIWTALGAMIIVGSGLYVIHREHVHHRALTKGVVGSGAVIGPQNKDLSGPK